MSIRVLPQSSDTFTQGKPSKDSVQKCYENLSSVNVPTLVGLLQSVHAGEFDNPDRAAFYQFLDQWEKRYGRIFKIYG